MRDASATFQAILERQGDSSLVPLVEIALDSGTLYAAGHTRNVTFGGTLYYADNIDFEIIETTDEQAVKEWELALQNIRDPEDDTATRPWSTLTNDEDVSGAEVTLRIVSLDDLDDEDSQIAETRWYVSGWELGADYIRMRMAAPFDALALEILQPSIASHVELRDANGRLLPETTFPVPPRGR